MTQMGYCGPLFYISTLLNRPLPPALKKEDEGYINNNLNKPQLKTVNHGKSFTFLDKQLCN
jgi:hypothetical protein